MTGWFRRFALNLMLLSSCLFACSEESSRPVVDAMVDIGPECVAGPDGNALCVQRYGERSFCNADGACQELGSCEEETCCAPGEMGDTYCLELNGPGSRCELDGDVGRCSERACAACQPDGDGHTCCYDALGASWFCGEGGRCQEVMNCEQDDCCVPGPGGDAKCARIFGESSNCTQLNNGGQCVMSAPPPCAGCMPEPTGHSCCRDEFGADWFCGLQGICNPSSGCERAECCLPSEQGDTYCRDTFGEESVCRIIDRDGRCSPATPPAE
ncbi:MAG: hypothetical protein VYA30_16885 [Myxococcota bacterium]|nr:hypothetical protein [Myxococcota bacterium]